MQIDKIKWAADNAALKVEANGNQQQRGWDTADGTITGNPDQPTLQTTNGWMHAVYSWLEYINGIRTPIGTILTSALSEEQFNSVTSGNWALCDGRDVGGSQWSTITLGTNAPDLRGYILGGAGSSGITLQETGAPVEDIASLNQYVDENISLRSLSGTAEAGDTTFDVGGKTVNMQGFTFSGSTGNNANNYRLSLDATQRVDRPQNNLKARSDWTEAQLFGSGGSSNDNIIFTVTNFQHQHRVNGYIAAKNITGSNNVKPTPTSSRLAYPEQSNERAYNFIPNSFGVNYFLRID